MKGSPKIAKYSMKCINTVYSETSTVERLFNVLYGNYKKQNMLSLSHLIFRVSYQVYN